MLQLSPKTQRYFTICKWNIYSHHIFKVLIFNTVYAVALTMYNYDVKVFVKLAYMLKHGDTWDLA